MLINRNAFLFLVYFVIAALAYSDETLLLKWEEDFTGKSLNSKYWNIETGYGLWGNEELEEYTKNKNIKIINGCLEISATKKGSRYYSARINTKDKFSFLYGKIEARIRLPYGNGMWPAFWMMGKVY